MPFSPRCTSFCISGRCAIEILANSSKNAAISVLDGADKWWNRNLGQPQFFQRKLSSRYSVSVNHSFVAPPWISSWIMLNFSKSPNHPRKVNLKLGCLENLQHVAHNLFACIGWVVCDVYYTCIDVDLFFIWSVVSFLCDKTSLVDIDISIDRIANWFVC